MNLFDFDDKKQTTAQPLSARMRPETLDDVIGQEHIIGKDKLLYRAIQADRLTSLILYGPPGTGKTTLAHVIANTSKSYFSSINATTSGKKDMEAIVKKAKDLYRSKSQKTILFIDEIHRFNTSQQDYLLPFVEDGTIILIGATTENPYFEVNGALLSRSIVFELHSLTKENIIALLRRAIDDPIKGVGGYMVRIDDDAISFIAETSDGDARIALNALELAVLTTVPKDDGYIEITLDVASECLQKKTIRYDAHGDHHYDTISAFIKSMRGSDPDAAVYYLARMLEAGEDIRFIARRIMICASEDVGMADPRAIELATSCCLAIERVGMPEARIILSQATIYVATAPKSNSCYKAIDKAYNLVNTYGNLPIPPHLQDAHYGGSTALGRGLGYKYTHDFPNHYTDQQYLPNKLLHHAIYEMSDVAYEGKLKKYFDHIHKPYNSEKTGDDK